MCGLEGAFVSVLDYRGTGHADSGDNHSLSRAEAGGEEDLTGFGYSGRSTAEAGQLVPSYILTAFGSCPRLADIQRRRLSPKELAPPLVLRHKASLLPECMFEMHFRLCTITQTVPVPVGSGGVASPPAYFTDVSAVYVAKMHGR